MIKQKIAQFAVIFSIICLGSSVAYAQTGAVINAIPTKEPAFCGFIDFEFKVKGELAEELKLVNDIKYMTLILREGDFIIQLYGDEIAGPQNPKHYDPANPMLPQIKQVFPTTRVFLSDSNRMYIVDAANRRVFKNESYELEKEAIPVAMPLGDSIKVLNVMCYGYKVKKKDEEIIFYISPKYRADLAFYPEGTAAKASFLTQGLGGCIPLKTIRKNAERTIEIVATRIQRKNLKKEEFSIPRGFKILGYDYRR
jgi:hypothetical protein